MDAVKRLLAGPMGRHLLNAVLTVVLAYGVQVGLVSPACRADVQTVLFGSSSSWYNPLELPPPPLLSAPSR